MKVYKVVKKSIIFILICIFILYLATNIYALITPKLNIYNNGTFYLYDNNNELVYQGSTTSYWSNLKDINDNLKNAVISIEDKNFYNHHGFDIFRIGKALTTNIKNKRIVQGASTISQQLVKNLYLDFSKTWKRKIKEAFLTVITEIQYNKDEILEAYLNTINYGNGNYGVYNASKFYFDKDVKNLTLEESIILAGIPKSPNKYNPISNYEKSIERAKLVAKSMKNNNYITEEEYLNLDFDNVNISNGNNKNKLKTIMYYQDAVYNELYNLGINKETLKSGGLKIYTNLDLDKQEELENNINKYMTEDNELQISSIIVDPNSGKIEALVGGKDYNNSKYNRALNSKRQVGSTMKPFLYYTALENNMTSASTFKSEYTIFNLEQNKTYSPTNYGNRYANKDITMAAAIAFSDNIYAVKTNLFLGGENLINISKKVGIKETLNNVPSLALGTSEINIIDFATGYTTLADMGYKKELYFINKIEDKKGNIIYQKKENKSLVLNPNYVYILNELLTNTTNSKFQDYTTGTATNIASKLTRKYSIKTGTTDTDYWDVGYNKDDLVIIWIGYDDNRNFIKKYSNIGKSILADTLESIQQDLPKSNWYKKPDNVVGLYLDPISGKEVKDQNLGTIFYFLKGSEPISNNPIYIKTEE